MALELWKKKWKASIPPVGENEKYKDDSNEILKSNGVEEGEESDSDFNM